TYLLSYAEIAENYVKDVLNIHLTGQPAQAVGGQAKLLGDNVLASGWALSQNTVERSLPQIQGFAMPFSGQKARFHPEIGLGVAGQLRQEFSHAQAGRR